MSKNLWAGLLSVAFVFSSLGVANAANMRDDRGYPKQQAGQAAKGTKDMKQTREERAKMQEEVAKMHQKAADCLRSDKTEDQCMQEMRENCPAAMAKNKGECRMGFGMHGKGGKYKKSQG